MNFYRFFVIHQWCGTISLEWAGSAYSEEGANHAGTRAWPNCASGHGNACHGPSCSRTGVQHLRRAIHDGGTFRQEDAGREIAALRRLRFSRTAPGGSIHVESDSRGRVSRHEGASVQHRPRSGCGMVRHARSIRVRQAERKRSVVPWWVSRLFETGPGGCVILGMRHVCWRGDAGAALPTQVGERARLVVGRQENNQPR